MRRKRELRNLLHHHPLQSMSQVCNKSSRFSFFLRVRSLMLYCCIAGYPLPKTAEDQVRLKKERSERKWQHRTEIANKITSSKYAIAVDLAFNSSMMSKARVHWLFLTDECRNIWVWHDKSIQCLGGWEKQLFLFNWISWALIIHRMSQ